MQKKKGQGGVLSKKLSLRNPQTLENCFSILNGNLSKIKRNATKIITVLPENSLTPIPVKEKNAVRGVAGLFNKNQYKNAERTAVFIRRMEYSSGVQKHFKPSRKNEENLNKIIIIQEWWKTMYKIIRLQKCVRGFLFRRKLMKSLEHQERLLQFITVCDNIHGYHLYNEFFTNFKNLYNQIKAKQLELLEDFSEKMEKIEKLNNLKKLKNKFSEWRRRAEEVKKLEKARQFHKLKIAKKIMMSWTKAHKFKKILLKVLKNNCNEQKKQLLDQLYKNKIKIDNDYTKAKKKKKKIFQNRDNSLKKEYLDKMKILDFMDHLMDLKEVIDNKHKKDCINRLKQIYDYFRKKDIFDHWKNAINKTKIFKKLIKIKKKELEKKKNFTIDSNVNNLNLLNETLSPLKSKSNEISISNENSINILKKDSPLKILSVGNAGIDFSILAPEIFNLQVDPSEKIPKTKNLIDVFRQSEDVVSLLNNMKIKKYFDEWKNKTDLKKILKNLKKNKIKTDMMNQGKNKLLELIGNKLKQRNFAPIINDKDKMLEKAFQIWKSLEVSINKAQNFKKIKLKVVRNKIDEGTQKSLDKTEYSIQSKVNDFEIISDKINRNNGDMLKNKKNANNIRQYKNEEDKDKDNNIKNNNSQLKSNNLLNDNLNNIKNNLDNIDNDDILNSNPEKIRICKNELFTLERAYDNNENIDGKNSQNDEDTLKNILDKKEKIPKKRRYKLLIIQKDNSFSIINQKYIPNELKSFDEENKNSIDEYNELLNKLKNDESNNGEQDIERFDDINKVNEINEFFPNDNENLIYLRQKTDNLIFGPNSEDILSNNADLNNDLEKNKEYYDALEKLSKRKIKPFDNLEEYKNELFSIINNQLIDEMNNRNNNKLNELTKDNNEDLLKNKIYLDKKLNNEENNINPEENKDKNEDYYNSNYNDRDNVNKNKLNLLKLYNNNESILDDYKLYHAEKFTLWPKDFVQEENNNSEKENESDKIIELPIVNKGEGNSKDNLLNKIRERKPFNNLIIDKDQSFSIFGEDSKNKINDDNLEKNKNLNDNDNQNEKEDENTFDKNIIKDISINKNKENGDKNENAEIPGDQDRNIKNNLDEIYKNGVNTDNLDNEKENLNDENKMKLDSKEKEDDEVEINKYRNISDNLNKENPEDNKNKDNYPTVENKLGINDINKEIQQNDNLNESNDLVNKCKIDGENKENENGEAYDDTLKNKNYLDQMTREENEKNSKPDNYNTIKNDQDEINNYPEKDNLNKLNYYEKSKSDKNEDNLNDGDENELIKNKIINDNLLQDNNQQKDENNDNLNNGNNNEDQMLNNKNILDESNKGQNNLINNRNISDELNKENTPKEDVIPQINEDDNNIYGNNKILNDNIENNKEKNIDENGEENDNLTNLKNKSDMIKNDNILKYEENSANNDKKEQSDEIANKLKNENKEENDNLYNNKNILDKTNKENPNKNQNLNKEDEMILEKNKLNLDSYENADIDKSKELDKNNNINNLEGKNDFDKIRNNKNLIDSYNKENDENRQNKIYNDSLNKSNENINNENQKYPNNCINNIYQSEKIDLMYGPSQISKNKNNQRKPEENRIVKNNNLKIYDDNNNKNINFSPDKQYIDKFNVLIEPDLNQIKKGNKYQNMIVSNYNNTIYSKPKPIKKIEKVDNENQTLNNEYTISKPNKNDFTIFSYPNQKQLSFKNERTQFDSINSFSIEIDKKKIDLIKGANLLGKIIKKNKFKELMDLLQNKNNNAQRNLQNLITKRNDIASLRKYFDIWKNPGSLRERILKRILDNVFKKKLKLQKMIRDLPNNDKNDIAYSKSRKYILNHYLNKWKDIADALTKILKDKKGKKRISMRKNLNKRTKNKNTLKAINKFQKERDNLKKYFEKWKDNALNNDEIINHKTILQKMKEYQKNKLLNDSKSNIEKDNETNQLINKLKKALLQALLHLYKKQRNKLLKKYFDIWKDNKIKKYKKNFLFGNKAYKFQDPKFFNCSSGNNSLLDSNSSNAKYYPTKVSKYNSIDKMNKNHNVINMSNNIKKNKDINDRYYKNNDSNIQGPYTHTYNANDNLLRNMSFGDYKSLPTEQNKIYPNMILEKIKNRSEKFSNEFQNSNITQSPDPDHKKNVSMIQRIKQFYRSPSGIDNTNFNTNLTSNRSNNNILNSQNQNLLKKKKNKKMKKKYLDNLNKHAEEQKDQNSDESSVCNSVMDGMKLQGTKTENLEPVIYTSQCFFIDKKSANPDAKEMPTVSYYKSITNKFPMKMKGDFRQLIEKNPEILKQKNPRIQVTNATCELEQFGEANKNKNIFSLDDINLLKLNPNVNVKNKYKNKNTEMKNIVSNCDRDIYEPHKIYEPNPQKWISMSIPLKNGVAKWEFLNSVKGVKHKNNTNKFELIQKNKSNNINNNNNSFNSRSIKLIEKKRGKSEKSHSLSKISEDPIEQNVQYNLREMNYSQFYHSPLNTHTRKDGEESPSSPVKLVKKEEKKNIKKKNGHHLSRISSADYISKNTYYNNKNNENK